MTVSFIASPSPAIARVAPVLGVLLLGALPAARAGAQERTDTTVALERAATVEVSGGSHDVTVSVGADRTLRVRGGADTRLAVRGAGRTVVVQPAGRRSGGAVMLEVPRGTTVLARTQSGDVTVRGTGADVEVVTLSGDVRVEEGERVRVESVSGDVTVRGARDGVRVEATSGDVRVEEVDGDLEVRLTSGSVTLRGVASRRVAVKTVSGDVDWAGVLVPDGRYDFGAHSGDLRLALPRDVGAALDVRTFSGELDTGPLALTLVPDAPRAGREREARELAEARDKLAALRDSLQRLNADSSRVARARQRERERPPGWEGQLQRTVDGVVESVLSGVTIGLASAAGAMDNLAERTRGQRYTLGRGDGARVTLSSFSGTIRLRPLEGAAPRRE